MKAYRYISFLGIVLILTLISPLVFAMDTESTRATLKGFTGMMVVIEAITPEIEKDGLTKSQIQTDVELKLRMAVLKVLTIEEGVQEEGKPYLYVNLNAHKRADSSYIYKTRVEFKQEAFLRRNPILLKEHPSYLPTVATWSTGSLGINSSLSDIRNIIKDRIDIFLNAYLSVNPKP